VATVCHTRIEGDIVNPPKRLARIAGVLYLIVAIVDGFAHLYARASVYAPGNAAATAEKVAANSALFRLGFVADLVQATCFLFVGMALYLLLKHVNKNVARAMVIFVALAVATMCLNLLHHFAALIVATDGSYAAALGHDGSDALVLLLLDMHHYGFLIAQAPDIGAGLSRFVLAPAAVAELAMIAWLLVEGVRATTPVERVAVAA
jgi:Domain of unknown function (DUF4386)